MSDGLELCRNGQALFFKSGVPRMGLEVLLDEGEALYCLHCICKGAFNLAHSVQLFQDGPFLNVAPHLALEVPVAAPEEIVVLHLHLQPSHLAHHLRPLPNQLLVPKLGLLILLVPLAILGHFLGPGLHALPDEFIVVEAVVEFLDGGRGVLGQGRHGAGVNLDCLEAGKQLVVELLLLSLLLVGQVLLVLFRDEAEVGFLLLHLLLQLPARLLLLSDPSLPLPLLLPSLVLLGPPALLQAGAPLLLVLGDFELALLQLLHLDGQSRLGLGELKPDLPINLLVVPSGPHCPVQSLEERADLPSHNPQLLPFLLQLLLLPLVIVMRLVQIHGSYFDAVDFLPEGKKALLGLLLGSQPVLEVPHHFGEGGLPAQLSQVLPHLLDFRVDLDLCLSGGGEPAGRALLLLERPLGSLEVCYLLVDPLAAEGLVAGDVELLPQLGVVLLHLPPRRPQHLPRLLLTPLQHTHPHKQLQPLILAHLPSLARSGATLPLRTLGLLGLSYASVAGVIACGEGPWLLFSGLCFFFFEADELLEEGVVLLGGEEEVVFPAEDHLGEEGGRQPHHLTHLLLHLQESEFPSGHGHIQVDELRLVLPHNDFFLGAFLVLQEHTSQAFPDSFEPVVVFVPEGQLPLHP